MRYINDEICIINHRILRHIGVRESNRKDRKRRLFNFILVELVECDDFLHTSSGRWAVAICNFVAIYNLTKKLSQFVI